jgi:hypothetical protein
VRRGEVDGAELACAELEFFTPLSFACALQPETETTKTTASSAAENFILLNISCPPMLYFYQYYHISSYFATLIAEYFKGPQLNWGPLKCKLYS